MHHYGMPDTFLMGDVLSRFWNPSHTFGPWADFVAPLTRKSRMPVFGVGNLCSVLVWLGFDFESKNRNLEITFWSNVGANFLKRNPPWFWRVPSPYLDWEHAKTIGKQSVFVTCLHPARQPVRRSCESGLVVESGAVLYTTLWAHFPRKNLWTNIHETCTVLLSVCTWEPAINTVPPEPGGHKIYNFR